VIRTMPGITPAESTRGSAGVGYQRLGMSRGGAIEDVHAPNKAPQSGSLSSGESRVDRQGGGARRQPRGRTESVGLTSRRKAASSRRASAARLCAGVIGAGSEEGAAHARIVPALYGRD